MSTDWLALINCAAFSPTVYTQVQENLLLPFSNSPPTSVNNIWHGMSSRLLRYHDENIRHARRPVLHSFPGKLCRPLHVRVARYVAQCRSTPKAVQSVQIWIHPRHLKVELISDYNCHIRAHRPKTSKELLL